MKLYCSELRCTGLYLTGNFGLICWTKNSFCGNLVPVSELVLF